MDNSKEEQLTKEQYNEIPVFYCRDCLSLKVKTVILDSGLDYCDECGSTNIGQTSIEEWRKLYKERHGFDYLDNNYKYGREE